MNPSKSYKTWIEKLKVPDPKVAKEVKKSWVKAILHYIPKKLMYTVNAPAAFAIDVLRAHKVVEASERKLYEKAKKYEIKVKRMINVDKVVQQAVEEVKADYEKRLEIEHQKMRNVIAILTGLLVGSLVLLLILYVEVCHKDGKSFKEKLLELLKKVSRTKVVLLSLLVGFIVLMYTLKKKKGKVQL